MEIEIDIIAQKLDDMVICPLCQYAMYDTEADILGRVYQFYQCKHCHHQIYPNEDRVCHCEVCKKEQQKQIRETAEQEKKQYTAQAKSHVEIETLPQMNDLNFTQKLFVLSVLDYHVNEERTHGEYIAWDKIKYFLITPNYQYQSSMFKYLIKLGFIQEYSEIAGLYYLKLSFDGVYDSSLYSIHQALKSGFYTHLNEYIPFKHENEVKFALSQIMYEEIIQFMQYTCKAWKIQIAGNIKFEKFCQNLMEHLALSQIFYLVQQALHYLYENKLLKKKNDDFVNTNLLRKTLVEYERKITNEKWETASILRPQDMPMSHMSSILYYRFLNLREDFYYQPLWKLWQTVQPRLHFFAQRRCFNCGSTEILVEYDQFQLVSLRCQACDAQYHYKIG